MGNFRSVLVFSCAVAAFAVPSSAGPLAAAELESMVRLLVELRPFVRKVPGIKIDVPAGEELTELQLRVFASRLDRAELRKVLSKVKSEAGANTVARANYRATKVVFLSERATAQAARGWLDELNQVERTVLDAMIDMHFAANPRVDRALTREFLAARAKDGVSVLRYLEKTDPNHYSWFLDDAEGLAYDIARFEAGEVKNPVDRWWFGEFQPHAEHGRFMDEIGRTAAAPIHDRSVAFARHLAGTTSYDESRLFVAAILKAELKMLRALFAKEVSRDAVLEALDALTRIELQLR